MNLVFWSIEIYIFQLVLTVKYHSLFTGLITTTSRKLDREQQAEHFLEVRLRGKYMLKG